MKIIFQKFWGAGAPQSLQVGNPMSEYEGEGVRVFEGMRVMRVLQVFEGFEGKFLMFILLISHFQ